MKKDIPVIYVKDCFVFTFYSIKSYNMSLIHFEFIFVYGVKKCSNFIFFSFSYPIVPAPFIEGTLFPSLYILTCFVID